VASRGGVAGSAWGVSGDAWEVVATAPLRVHIVGCGRWSMSDDRAGLIIAERLQNACADLGAIVASEDPVDALTDPAIAQTDLLIVVDASPATDSHPIGTFQRIDYRARREAIGKNRRGDTHTLSVETALELAEALGLLPPRVWIYVIFGTDFERGLALSDRVAAGVDGLVKRIEHDLRELTAACPCTS